MRTTDLIEWLNSFTRKASDHYHHHGIESQKFVSLFLFVQEIRFSVSLLLFVFWFCSFLVKVLSI